MCISKSHPFFKNRQQDIVSKLENSFTIIPQIPSNPTVSKAQLVAHASQETMTSLKNCFSPKVFIAALLPDFFRLFLQIIARYRIWIVQGTNLEEFTEQHALSNLDTEHQIYFVHDLNELGKFVATFFDNKEELPASFWKYVPSQTISSMKKASLSSIKQLKELETTIAKRLCELLAERSLEKLNPIKDIPAQYRHTEKSPPTEASPFISNLFIPFQQFFEENKQLLNEEIEKQWGALISNRLISSFHRLIVETLDDFERSEAMLKKLSRRDSVSVLGLSYKDKIMMQFHLDTKQFLKLLEDEMKFDVSSNETVPLLIELTALGKQHIEK